MQDPYCQKCATPEVTTNTCTWHGRCYGFDKAFALGLYYPSRGDPSSIGWDDFLSKHIRGAKMYPGYAIPLGWGLSLCVNNIYTELKKTDLIVPVPKFETELKKAIDHTERMYNQAAEIAKIVSDKTEITYAEPLIKLKAQKMKDLSTADERWAAVKGLYKVSDEDSVKNKKILLIDDVFTTGASVSECSEMLTNAGAKHVNILVAGRDTG